MDLRFIRTEVFRGVNQMLSRVRYAVFIKAKLWIWLDLMLHVVLHLKATAVYNRERRKDEESAEEEKR